MAMDPVTGKVKGWKPYKGPRGQNPHRPKPAPAIPPAHIVSSGQPMRGNSKLRYARATWMIERRLRGESVADLAKALNLRPTQVFAELARAEERGIVDKVRERLLDTLDKHANSVYKEVLEATPEKLQENSRGYGLKLKAADSLSAGLGIFKAESVRETKSTLALVAEESANAPTEKVVEGHRVLFKPEIPALPAPDTSANGSANPGQPPPSTLLSSASGGVSEGVSPSDPSTKASDSECAAARPTRPG